MEFNFYQVEFNSNGSLRHLKFMIQQGITFWVWLTTAQANGFADSKGNEYNPNEEVTVWEDNDGEMDYLDCPIGELRILNLA
jgi:hypothetical protein